MPWLPSWSDGERLERIGQYCAESNVKQQSLPREDVLTNTTEPQVLERTSLQTGFGSR